MNYTVMDMEKLTGFKLGKEYVKAVYYHLAYLTSMQNTSCEMLGWMKHKLESRLMGERGGERAGGVGGRGELEP